MKLKLSKEGKLFSARIKALRIPRYSVQQTMANIYFSNSHADFKVNKCAEVIKHHEPKVHSSPKQLGAEIINFYRYLVPPEAFRRDGLLKSNFLNSVEGSELALLMNELNKIKQENGAFLSVFEGINMVYFLNEKKK